MDRPPRRRRSFLRELEQRYSQKRAADPRARRGKQKQPVAYPTAVRPKRRESPGKGVIDMTIQQFVALALFFVLLASAASAGVAYGVVELTAGGPQGEQGIAGERGPKGDDGARGPIGPAENDAAVERLATLWAVQQLSGLNSGAFVELKHPNVVSCVEYVLTGDPDIGACPGFTAGGN